MYEPRKQQKSYRNIVLSEKRMVALVSFALLLPTPVTLAVWLIWGPASCRTSVELAEDIRSYPCHDDSEVYIAKDVRNLVSPKLVLSLP